MSTIKVDTVTTLDGTGNITLSRPLTGLSGSGASLTALNATELTSGTVPDARFPSTLPAASGVNLTALNATQLTSGTIPIARIADDAITLAKMADDAIGVAQLSATGTASNTTFLRGDNSWTTAGVTPKMKMLHTTYAFSGAPGTQTLSGVGFAPDAIFGMWGVGNSTYKTPNIFWAINSSSSLAQSGTRAFNAWRHNERSTAGSWMWANAGMQWIDSHNDYVQGTVTTWGSDGITITYTVTGSPTTSQTMNQSTVYFKLT